MRQKRIDRGALTLASAEVKFQIDTETHDPLDIGMFLFFNPLRFSLLGEAGQSCFLLSYIQMEAYEQNLINHALWSTTIWKHFFSIV